MASEDSKREVIAHFSTAKLIVATAGISGFAVLGAVMAWDLIFVRPTDDRIKYGLDIWGFAIFFVGVALLFFYLFRTVRAAIESKGIALWLEDGRLMHADKKLLDVPAQDVLSVELVREIVDVPPGLWRRPRMTVIVVRLKDGKQAKLSASSFAENRDDIVVDLRKKLGLAGA